METIKEIHFQEMSSLYLQKAVGQCDMWIWRPKRTGGVMRKVRGPGRKPRKIQVSIRLDPDVLDQWKGLGPGWQSDINKALRDCFFSYQLKKKMRAKDGLFDLSA